MANRIEDISAQSLRQTLAPILLKQAPRFTGRIRMFSVDIALGLAVTIGTWSLAVAASGFVWQ